MRIRWLSFFGIIAIIASIVLLFVLVQPQFPQQGFLRFPTNMTLTPIQEAIGQEVSAVLWSQRQLDLIALAFVLFATATCCRAMLREEEEG